MTLGTAYEGMQFYVPSYPDKVEIMNESEVVWSGTMREFANAVKALQAPDEQLYYISDEWDATKLPEGSFPFENAGEGGFMVPVTFPA